MSQIVTKSAISVLDEFCKRKVQSPPVYSFSQKDGEIGFVCTVASFNETKTGKAQSKKKAKHLAALNLINHLRSLKSFEFDLTFLQVSPDVADETNKVSSSTSNGSKCKATVKSEPEINYVGKLLEHCTKNKLPPAAFDLIEQTTNASKKSEFLMKCSVNGVEKYGSGLNKKQARQRAAMEVLNVLTTEQLSPNDHPKIDEPPTKRLKTIEGSNGVASSSTSSGNIVSTQVDVPTSSEQIRNIDSEQTSDND